VKMKVLITGTAGFVGSHVAPGLLGRDKSGIGLGNLGDHSVVWETKARLSRPSLVMTRGMSVLVAAGTAQVSAFRS